MLRKIPIKIKYLILIILLLSIGDVYLMSQKEEIAETGGEKISCASCASGGEPSVSKIEIPGQKTFEDTVQFSVVATAMGPRTKYFNWKPKNPCPGNEDCYLKNITALATFLNAGDPSILSEEGAGFIQIANSEESNCTDPSQATFTKYLAYSPALAGGESWTKRTCGESATQNTCNLTKEDGFDGKSNCFSLKLFAPSSNEGEINFAAHLIFITYTYETQ